MEWRDDLKKALLIAGDEGKPLTFLFTDTQVITLTLTLALTVHLVHGVVHEGLPLA